MAGDDGRPQEAAVTTVPIDDFVAAIDVEQLDADPYPIYARLRREAPVCYVPAVNLWFITRWHDVEQAAQRPDLFSAAVDPSPVSRSFGENNILTVDGPRHKQLRAMLDPSFRPRVVEQYATPLIAPLIEQQLAQIEDKGEADLMAEYFEPISVLSLGVVLGLAEFDADTLRRWFAALALGATNFEANPDKQRAADAASAEIDAALAPLFARLLARPDGSTIAHMLHAAEGPLAARVAQIMPTLKVILLGGMQEPGHAGGSTSYGLLSNPEQLEMFLADPAGQVRAAVDEGLRWVSPIGTQTRRVTRDTELGGATLPAGANVGLLLSSANRDEAVWGDDADRFRLERRRPTQAAFGFGSHYCSGHHFSRVQMRMALEALFTRLPGLRLQEDHWPELRGWEFRAPAHLHVRWDS
jgi:cytochrome P450